LSSLSLGEQLPVRCDGCPAGLTAAVSYIAREPEFTPPVIYSLDERQTLVYLVEARPIHDVALKLQPGQIVDVDLPQRRP
jgi:HlyD family secretion protein